ncbi:MAG TPA: glycerophosphodiester phosphodiesterase family protein [Gaiellaceae bacterium]
MAPLTTLVIAHRGHSAGAPEQTMAAFTQAIELGAEMIEADVRRTRDGRLVMCHDADVGRTTDGAGPVSAFDYEDLRRLDAGSWFDPSFRSERVPTLDELYDLAAGAGVTLCLEVKGETEEEQSSLAHAVAGEIARRGRLDVDFLSSFGHRALLDAREAFPGLRTAPDRLPERGHADAEATVGQALSIGAAVVQHHHEDLDAGTVRCAHDAGIAVWAWPVLTTDEIERAIALGVDGVMGDDVAAMRGVVG